MDSSYLFKVHFSVFFLENPAYCSFWSSESTFWILWPILPSCFPEDTLIPPIPSFFPHSNCLFSFSYGNRVLNFSTMLFGTIFAEFAIGLFCTFWNWVFLEVFRGFVVFFLEFASLLVVLNILEFSSAPVLRELSAALFLE